MKIWKRTLSVGLSLVLCGSMVLPGFAASFSDLQNAIDGSSSGTQIDGTDRWGYGWNETENRYGVEAWTEDDTRKVELNEDVKYEKEGDDANLFKDNYQLGGILIKGEDKKVEIELNGHDIDLNPGAELNVEDGKFYDTDGNAIADSQLNKGAVITVADGATLTVNDSSAKDEDGNYVAGKGTGSITGGNKTWDENRISGGDFTAKNQKSAYQGAGLSVINGCTFIMNGGSITGNRGNDTHGGGILIGAGGSNASNGTLNGVIVSDNWVLGNGGGVRVSSSNLTVINSVIDGNKSGRQSWDSISVDGTITVLEGGKLTINGKEVTYPNGATIGNDGANKNKDLAVTKTETKDGDTVTSTTIKTEDGGKKTAQYEVNGKTDVDETGTTDVPAGGSVKGGKTGTEVDATFPDGAKIDKDGSILINQGDKMTSVDENGKQTETTFPSEGGGKVNPDGTVEGSTVTKAENEDGNVVIKTDDGEGVTTETTVTVPTDKKDEVKVDENGTVKVPEGSKVTDKDGKEIDLPFGGTIDKDGTVTPNEDPNAGSNTGDNTTGGNTGSNTGTGSVDADAADEGLTTIEAEAVPLAGPVFLEDVLEELYKHEGSPDGEDPEGEYDLAIAWAIANEIIDEDDDVEEVVTVVILRDILTKYLDFAGIEYTLVIDGEDDDIVDNCGEILTELFAADR